MKLPVKLLATILGTLIIGIIIGSSIVFLVAPPSPAPLPKVTAASGWPGLTALVTKVLKDQGFDRKHGFILEPKYLEIADAEKATYLGITDFGLAVLPSVVKEELKGNPIRIFAPLFLVHMNWLAPKGKLPYGPKAFVGTRVASLPEVTMHFGLTNVLLKIHGVDIKKDPAKLIFGATLPIIGLLERGEVDVAATFEFHTTRLLATGKYDVVYALLDEWRKLTGQPLLGAGIGAKESWIKDNPKLAKAVLSAFLDAIRYIRENPGEVVDKYGKEIFGLKKTEELELAKKRLPPLFTFEWTEDFIKANKLFIEKGVEVGFFDRMPERDIFVFLKI